MSLRRTLGSAALLAAVVAMIAPPGGARSTRATHHTLLGTFQCHTGYHLIDHQLAAGDRFFFTAHVNHAGAGFSVYEYGFPGRHELWHYASPGNGETGYYEIDAPRAGHPVYHHYHVVLHPDYVLVIHPHWDCTVHVWLQTP